MEEKRRHMTPVGKEGTGGLAMLPEIERDVAKVVATTDCRLRPVEGEVAEVVQADGQVGIVRCIRKPTNGTLIMITRTLRYARWSSCLTYAASGSGWGARSADRSGRYCP